MDKDNTKKVEEKNYWPPIFIGMLIVISITTIIAVNDMTIRFSILGYFIGGLSTFILNNWFDKANVNKDNREYVKNAIMQMKCNKEIFDCLSEEGVGYFYAKLYVLGNSELKKLKLEWFSDTDKALIIRYINKVNYLSIDKGNKVSTYDGQVKEMLEETEKIIVLLESI